MNEAMERTQREEAEARERCEYCGEKHTYPHPIVRETVYLPIDCPNCGRHRLEFDGYHVVCEKCGSCDWEHPANPA